MIEKYLVTFLVMIAGFIFSCIIGWYMALVWRKINEQ